MDNFKKFIKEDDGEENYKLLILSHDDPNDPNETAPLVRDTAKKLGLKVYLAEFMGSYMEDDGDDKLFYSYPISKKGAVTLPGMKDDVTYDKPFKINPNDTLIMARGLNSIKGCVSWWTMARTLEHSGFKMVNSVLCNEICNDKWYNQIIFQRNNIKTPDTVLIRHSEGANFSADKLDGKFPMILKTSVGSQGIGVMWIESAKSLHGIVQLLYRENEYIDILLQEYIKTKYDVRVIVCSGEIIGAMKRPVIEGDFRSNVSQGSKPIPHKLTKLEESESLAVAAAVDGTIVGVDFIPAQDRINERPYFIEVNATPGLIGIDEALKGDGSVVEKILLKFKNKQYWRQ